MLQHVSRVTPNKNSVLDDFFSQNCTLNRSALNPLPSILCTAPSVLQDLLSRPLDSPSQTPCGSSAVHLPLLSLSIICTYHLDYFTFSHSSPVPGPNLLANIPTRLPMNGTQILLPVFEAHSVSSSLLTLSPGPECPFLFLLLRKPHSLFIIEGTVICTSDIVINTGLLSKQTISKQ